MFLFEYLMKIPTKERALFRHLRRHCSSSRCSREQVFHARTTDLAGRDLYEYLVKMEEERFPQHQMLQTELFTRSAPWRCSRPWDGSERGSRGTEVCWHSLLGHAGVRIWSQVSASGTIFGRLQEQVCTQLYRIGGSVVRNGRCLKLLELPWQIGISQST